MANNKKVDWKKHEKDTAESLGLRQTVSSGNQWYEKNDATTAEHPMDNELQFDADAKCTSSRHYKLDVDFLNMNRKRSLLHGKIFLLPVRFELGTEDKQVYDYIVISRDGFEYVTGLDSIKKYRKEAEVAREAKSDFMSRIAPMLHSLTVLAASANLTGKQKNLLYKTVDAIDGLLEEM